MCFHGNQRPWAIKHPFINLYFKYQSLKFICLPVMNSPYFQVKTTSTVLSQKPVVDFDTCSATLTFIAVIEACNWLCLNNHHFDVRVCDRLIEACN